MRLSYFPAQWKVALIIMILKPGKKPEQTKSYRLISLLPVMSKILEKLLFKRILPIMQENNTIPLHQFGFRRRHATIEQVHRVVRNINKDLEKGKYCTGIFLDIVQAFDKVWHLTVQNKEKCSL